MKSPTQQWITNENERKMISPQTKLANQMTLQTKKKFSKSSGHFFFKEMNGITTKKYQLTWEDDKKEIRQFLS